MALRVIGRPERGHVLDNVTGTLPEALACSFGREVPQC